MVNELMFILFVIMTVLLLRSLANQKRTEKALSLSENNYSDLFDHAIEGIYRTTPEGLYIHANMAHAQILGYSSPAELMAAITDVGSQVYVHSHQREELVEQLKFYGEVNGMEIQLYRKDGSAIWVSINARVVCDGQGEVRHIDGTLQDISQRKDVEAQIKRQKKEYQTILDSVPAYILYHDREGKIVRANKYAATMFGMPIREMIGKTISDLFPQEADQYMNENLKVINSEKPTIGTVERYNLPLGFCLWTKIDRIPYFKENGDVEGVIVFANDITGLKQAKDALKKSEEDLQTILEATTDGIWMWNFETNELFFSPRYYTMLGYDPGEFPASYESWVSLIHPDDLEKAIEITDQYLQTKRDHYDNNFRLRTKTGYYRWIKSKARVVERGENDAAIKIIGNHEDITDQKHLEQQLLQSHKLEAIGTLSGGIAHDFNNILSAIMGYTEMSLDEADGSKRRHRLEQVLLSCNRAKDLVRQILTFSRKSDQEKKLLDVRPVVKEVLKLLRATMPSTIKIQSDITGDSAVTMTNPTQIHQIVMNLCTNATHAMQEKGGVLGVTMDVLDMQLSTATQLSPDLKPGPYIRIEIRDTGQGIDPAILPQIFDPFFTTKETNFGTGLGLSVVYGIVKDHGGAITVSSNIGEGSIFQVYLPMTGHVESRIDIREESLPSGHERVLFVDDERILASLGQVMLQSAGYEVTTVTDSIRALEVFRSYPDDFDLVITDMTMPGITGSELFNGIKKIRSRIPVILCTGYSDLIDEAMALKLGFRRYLPKPLHKAELIRAVRDVLDTA